MARERPKSARRRLSPPVPQSLPQPPALNIDALAASDITRGVFSNLTMVSHNDTEFILAFAVHIGSQAAIVSRVFITPTHAKALLAALAENVARFDQRQAGTSEKRPPAS